MFIDKNIRFISRRDVVQGFSILHQASNYGKVHCVLDRNILLSNLDFSYLLGLLNWSNKNFGYSDNSGYIYQYAKFGADIIAHIIEHKSENIFLLFSADGNNSDNPVLPDNIVFIEDFHDFDSKDFRYKIIDKILNITRS